MTVECAFGRLKGRWRILRKQCDISIKKMSYIILACCILHNICEDQKCSYVNEWDIPDPEEPVQPHFDYLFDNSSTDMNDKRFNIIRILRNT